MRPKVSKKITQQFANKLSPFLFIFRFCHFNWHSNLCLSAISCDDFIWFSYFGKIKIGSRLITTFSKALVSGVGVLFRIVQRRLRRTDWRFGREEPGKRNQVSTRKVSEYFLVFFCPFLKDFSLMTRPCLICISGFQINAFALKWYPNNACLGWLVCTNNTSDSQPENFDVVVPFYIIVCENKSIPVIMEMYSNDYSLCSSMVLYA